MRHVVQLALGLPDGLAVPSACPLQSPPGMEGNVGHRALEASVVVASKRAGRRELRGFPAGDPLVDPEIDQRRGEGSSKQIDELGERCQWEV